MLSSKSMPPTPITSIWSAGLFRVLNWDIQKKKEKRGEGENNLKWIIQTRSSSPRKIQGPILGSSAQDVYSFDGRLVLRAVLWNATLLHFHAVASYMEGHLFLSLSLPPNSWMGPFEDFSSLKSLDLSWLWTSPEHTHQFLTHLHVLTPCWSWLFCLSPEQTLPKIAQIHGFVATVTPTVCMPLSQENVRITTITVQSWVLWWQTHARTSWR